MSYKFTCEKEPGNIVRNPQTKIFICSNFAQFVHVRVCVQNRRKLAPFKISRYTIIVLELFIHNCSCIRKFSHFNVVSPCSL